MFIKAKVFSSQNYPPMVPACRLNEIGSGTNSKSHDCLEVSSARCMFLMQTYHDSNSGNKINYSVEFNSVNVNLKC